ncbi:hypothetical protein ACEQUB_03582 [Ralstonia syzygii]
MQGAAKCGEKSISLPNSRLPAWSGYYAAPAVSGMPLARRLMERALSPLLRLPMPASLPACRSLCRHRCGPWPTPAPAIPAAVCASLTPTRTASALVDAVDVTVRRGGLAAFLGGSGGHRTAGRKKPAWWRAWCSAAFARLIWPAASCPATRWAWRPVRRSAGPAARPRWCCAPAGRRPAPCTDRWRWSGEPGGSAPGSGRR